MRFTLDILPAAIADIAETVRWYEDQHEALGAEFALEESPKTGEFQLSAFKLLRFALECTDE